LAEENKTKKKRRPTLTAEDRENEMIGLAVDLAEKQLRDGTAKSQVIVHYLKMASTKEHYEKLLLEKEVELKSAKTEALKSQKKIEELYRDAMSSIRKYRGESEEIIDD